MVVFAEQASDETTADVERLANRNVLIVGGSGYGKTTLEVRELVQEADRNDSAIVCIDPHTDSLAALFFAHLCERGHRHRVLYDRLAEIGRVIRWEFLEPSRVRSVRERLGHNQTRCEQFAEMLLRRRGRDSAAATPTIEEWLLAALNLYIYQRRRRPLADIRFAFQFEHPKFLDMLSACEDPETRCKFEEIMGSRYTPYKAAERLILGLCRSAAFQVRTEHSGGFDFDGHLDRNGILIIEGGEGGTLSADAMRAMMGAVVLKTLNYLRRRKREFPHVTLALDEANNAQLIGESGHETRALAELRKYGLGMHVLVQLLDFPSSRIERSVLANCATRRYFNCSDPRTAARLGEDLGGSYTTEGKKTRYYKDGSQWDAPATFDNPYADELRKLARGVCYTRRGSTNKLEHIVPLPNPFRMSSPSLRRLVGGLLKAVQQRPEYYSPGETHADSADQSPTPTAQKSEPDDSPFGI
jgi:hypothetical protein